MEEIRKFGEYIHPYRDGRSSSRVLDSVERLLDGGKDTLAAKPFNLFRRLKIRQRMGYYRWS